MLSTLRARERRAAEGRHAALLSTTMTAVCPARRHPCARGRIEPANQGSWMALLLPRTAGIADSIETDFAGVNHLCAGV